MRKLLKYWHDGLLGRLATKADIDNLYTQLSCLLEIREIIGRSTPLGPLRGWALSPDALLIVLRDVMARSSPRILEFGSGESTVAIAAALKMQGSGSLVTVEHDATFLASLRQRLQRLDLAQRVELHTVPIAAYEPRFGLPAFKSYDLTELTTDFDIALVDGPITHQMGAGARSVALEWCLARLKSRSAIYLDDAARLEESAIVDALRAAWPKVSFESVPSEKGLCWMGLAEHHVMSDHG